MGHQNRATPHSVLMHIAIIESITPATPTIRIFQLTCADASFYRLAGQWINVSRDIGGETITASFSVASSPASPNQIELAIRHSHQHALTRWLHESAKPGDRLHISNGQGNFIWHPDMPEPLLLIGAGTGIAPLMSIFRLAAAKRKPATLLYSITSQQEYLYRKELAALVNGNTIRQITTLTRPDPTWQGKTGRINRALLHEAGLSATTRCYLCGPREMVDDMADTLISMGVPENNVIFEKWW